MIDAVGTARAHGIPFLGTCGGFQHAILHLARELAGIADADHAEYGPTRAPRSWSRWSAASSATRASIRYTPGTLIAEIAGVDQRLERYHCSYGIAPRSSRTLEHAGVVFGAHDEDGAPRALELPDHPFFLGTLFQPELAGDGTRAHPVIRAFAEAVVSRRERGRSTRAAQLA